MEPSIIAGILGRLSNSKQEYRKSLNICKMPRFHAKVLRKAFFVVTIHN